MVKLNRLFFLSFSQVIVSKVWPVYLPSSTPLHYAAENGHEEIVQFLNKNGADIKIRNSDGYTCFDLAIMHKRENVIQCIKETNLTVCSDLKQMNAKEFLHRFALDYTAQSKRMAQKYSHIFNGKCCLGCEMLGKLVKKEKDPPEE